MPCLLDPRGPRSVLSLGLLVGEVGVRPSLELRGRELEQLRDDELEGPLDEATERGDGPGSESSGLLGPLSPELRGSVVGVGADEGREVVEGARTISGRQGTEGSLVVGHATTTPSA